MKHVEIPAMMQDLEIDKRGYPMPWVLFRDTQGVAHFAINDSTTTYACKTENLCSICGKRMGSDMWFVGGPMSAFHPHGAYLDPPVHHDCGTYALQVCPYLATPKWANNAIGPKVAAKLLTDGKAPAAAGFLDYNAGELSDRPEVFVFMKVEGFIMTSPTAPLRPVGRYLDLELWRHGQKVDDDTAKVLVAQYSKMTG